MRVMCEETAGAMAARIRRATNHLTRAEKTELAEKLEAIEASGIPHTPGMLLAALGAFGPRPAKSFRTRA
jgi:hypothetical protein